MNTTLIVVPCTKRKIWEKQPLLRGVPAQDVYTGPSFRINRQYAERFATSWIILSAKYGVLRPHSIVPGPYNVTFKEPRTNPVTVEHLKEQVRPEKFDVFDTVIVLGSKHYYSMVEAAFEPFSIAVVAPFARLPIGKYLQAVKQATVSGQRFGAPSTE